MARLRLSVGLVFTWDQTDITALLEAAPVLVAGADSAGRVAIFNRACETLTGFRRQDALGRPFVDTLVPAAWQSRVRRRFADLTAVELAVPHRNPWRRCAGDEVHGGSVVARRDGKGRGATFVVTLPLRRP